jgi:hypothetical protein
MEANIKFEDWTIDKNTTGELKYYAEPGVAVHPQTLEDWAMWISNAMGEVSGARLTDKQEPLQTRHAAL